MCGTDTPMYSTGTFPAYTYRFGKVLYLRIVLIVKSKGKHTLLLQALTVTGKWTKLVCRIGCKDRQLSHTYVVHVYIVLAKVHSH